MLRLHAGGAEFEIVGDEHDLVGSIEAHVVLDGLAAILWGDDELVSPEMPLDGDAVRLVGTASDACAIGEELEPEEVGGAFGRAGPGADELLRLELRRRAARGCPSRSGPGRAP